MEKSLNNANEKMTFNRRKRLGYFVTILVLILMGIQSTVRASDGDLQFGVRLGLNRNIYFSEYLSPIFSMDMGNGFEAGLV
ncbi:MAG: hypothetical protein FWD38_11905, partial [Oscillospiraceae bacterium]|nr:hypothetical protein [Oscillospiraceae bacterium]